MQHLRKLSLLVKGVVGVAIGLAISSMISSLPGSNGMLYFWSPPRVGLDTTVLHALDGMN